ncbi:hypothetical protein FJT64_020572 [Amphibalanus amphitrite]|uniref:Uncharacterized protein n=1 Tax=Amphibalanus amphitrite TaxID=1232801 RepID=A0A6A4WL69_AMPAM|nr:hypothetical protein FJT64_002690 [Amphibalanus amphitrite]KAF0308156.1 hypothetical protein FJT64_020572 [Amphibalanus amphitrite]
MESDAAACAEERQSVSELVRNYSDPPSENHGGGKRDRSESGDPAPAGKRGARDPGRSPTPRNSNVKEYLETALEQLETRMMASISKDLHEFRAFITAELGALTDRVRDLERHVEERDCEITELASTLASTRRELRELQDRTENAEMNSRIPCLVLSGRALAPRRSPSLGAPLQSAGHAVPPGGATADQARQAPADGPASARTDGAGRARGGHAGGGQSAGEAEDVYGLVIGAVRARLPGLNITEDDIDRAHRLPGANNKIIVRFVRSGPGSVRDQLMTRRLDLRGCNDLFINESLTAHKSQIYRSLLETKKAGRIYTVYTRWGHVYFKAEKFGTSTRVDSVEKLRELKLPVKE